MMVAIKVLFFLLVVFSADVHGQEKQCDAILDLTLIIDSSGSIKTDDFDKGKGALIDLVSRLNVAVKKAGVALINYASNVSLSAINEVFEFDKTELLQQIAALPRLGTHTATGDALALAKAYCDARCRDATQGIPRIFAVFTDGHSNVGQPVLPIAKIIREAPMEGTIFAIGIGNIGKTGQDELLEIAGDKDYVLNIASYLDLARVTNSITMQMCEFPAFILPGVKTQSEVKGNNTRYFKMNSLQKTSKNAFFEIEVNDHAGQVCSPEIFFFFRRRKTRELSFVYSSQRFIHRRVTRNHHLIHRELLLAVRLPEKSIPHLYHQVPRISISVSKV